MRYSWLWTAAAGATLSAALAVTGVAVYSPRWWGATLLCVLACDLFAVGQLKRRAGR